MTIVKRRKTESVQVDHIAMGSDHPIVVQSMTNTSTAHVIETVKQIEALADAGSEIVRITVDTPEAAIAVPEIRQRLNDEGYTVPLVGDFHFNGDRLLRDYPLCAQALSKYRINPGNANSGSSGNEKFNFLIDCAIEYGRPVRIGVNWGSLDKALVAECMTANQKKAHPLTAEEVMHKALIRSALESADNAQQRGLAKNKIVLSCKVSNAQSLINIYRELAQRCQYPLHIGLTEAGMGHRGIVASTGALAILLQEGIGDTLRVSLTPKPNEPRITEVQIAQEILQTLGYRYFTPQVTACPGCGRTTSNTFQNLASHIQSYLSHKMPQWQSDYKGVEKLHVAIMGCVVNGPGESKLANIGISLPGTGETPSAPVYKDGKKITTLHGADIATQFEAIIEQYVIDTYPKN